MHIYIYIYIHTYVYIQKYADEDIGDDGDDGVEDDDEDDDDDDNDDDNDDEDDDDDEDDGGDEDVDDGDDDADDDAATQCIKMMRTKKRPSSQGSTADVMGIATMREQTGAGRATGARNTVQSVNPSPYTQKLQNPKVPMSQALNP